MFVRMAYMNIETQAKTVHMIMVIFINNIQCLYGHFSPSLSLTSNLPHRIKAREKTPSDTYGTQANQTRHFFGVMFMVCFGRLPFIIEYSAQKSGTWLEFD